MFYSVNDVGQAIPMSEANKTVVITYLWLIILVHILGKFDQKNLKTQVAKHMWCVMIDTDIHCGTGIFYNFI